MLQVGTGVAICSFGERALIPRANRLASSDALRAVTPTLSPSTIARTPALTGCFNRRSLSTTPAFRAMTQSLAAPLAFGTGTKVS